MLRFCSSTLTGGSANSLHDPEVLRHFASERVLPLLVATWLEFRPEGDGTVDADASGSLLKGLNVLLVGRVVVVSRMML